MSLPTILDTPKAAKDVLAELDELTSEDVSPDSAIVSGAYDPGEEISKLAKDAYGRFLNKNALYINLYPSVVEMERDLVAAGLALLRGVDDTCGNVTSGGTESIMLAVKAARDYSRKTRPQVTTPRIVLPITAHPAFHKAAQYLGLDIVVTGVDPAGFRADLGEFEAALDDQTILAVGSAPNYSHGTVDPISDMSEMARQRGILFHVDGCVGGFYLSFMRRLGLRDAPFDFSLPGVTSISADLHKYAYTPKNASLVMYRSRELRQAAWFINSATTEYAVINPTIQSSRTIGPIAAAWSVLNAVGYEGYEKMTRDCQEATAKAIADIAGNRDVRVLADPEMCMFALASDTLNIFEIDDAMRDAGWILTPQFACGGSPANAHVSLHAGVVDRMSQFPSDLAACTEKIKRSNTSVDVAGMKQALAGLEGAPLEDVMATMMPLAGLRGPKLPEHVAGMNTMLDLLPAAMRDAAFAMYLSATR